MHKPKRRDIEIAQREGAVTPTPELDAVLLLVCCGVSLWGWHRELSDGVRALMLRAARAASQHQPLHGYLHDSASWVHWGWPVGAILLQSVLLFFALRFCFGGRRWCWPAFEPKRRAFRPNTQRTRRWTAILPLVLSMLVAAHALAALGHAIADWVGPPPRANSWTELFGQPILRRMLLPCLLVIALWSAALASAARREWLRSIGERAAQRARGARWRSPRSATRRTTALPRRYAGLR